MSMFRIKQILKEKSIKVVDLATTIGIQQTNLSSIINGRSNPSLDMLQKIADALNVPIKELFADEGIDGYIKIKGIVHEIHSWADIDRLLEQREE